MPRGEVGAWPLLVEIIRRVILYHHKNSPITMATIMFGKESKILPRYTDKFNLNLEHPLQLNKGETTCHKVYDVYESS